jgi:RimJ/RimL family protein N-acetyltransferase
MKTGFPEVSDGLVRIVPFTREHLTEKYVAWLNDEAVVRFSEQRHRRHTLQSCEQYFISQSDSDNYFLAIEALNEDFSHVGNMGVSVDLQNSVADVSIIIGEKKTWGTGIGTAAWNLVVNTLLTKFKFRLVTAGTMEVNEPMVKLMKRSGMQIDAILPGRFLWEGKDVGMVSSSIQLKR